MKSLLSLQKLAKFWKNAIGWLNQGRKGVVGVWPDRKLLSQTDVKHEETEFRKDLSVFVCTVHKEDQVQEMHDFVAEGGGLLIGGHVWHWSYSHVKPMTEFSGMIMHHKGFIPWFSFQPTGMMI